MKLKKLKDQLGGPLCWSDYLSLPFTQDVSYSYWSSNTVYALITKLLAKFCCLVKYIYILNR